VFTSTSVAPKTAASHCVFTTKENALFFFFISYFSLNSFLISLFLPSLLLLTVVSTAALYSEGARCEFQPRDRLVFSTQMLGLWVHRKTRRDRFLQLPSQLIIYTTCADENASLLPKNLSFFICLGDTHTYTGC
jgi:hypothetical protein